MAEQRRECRRRPPPKRAATHHRRPANKRRCRCPGPGPRRVLQEVMSKLIVIEYASLDGVIQGPGHAGEDLDGGFDAGGWTVAQMPEHRRYNTESFQTAGASCSVAAPIRYGRNTGRQCAMTTT